MIRIKIEITGGIRFHFSNLEARIMGSKIGV